MKIAIIDQVPLSAEHAKKIKSNWGAKIYGNTKDSEEETIRRSKSLDIMILKWVNITPRVIDNAKNLKYIICASAGYGGVATAYAAKKGITVLNCPLHNSDTVASYTIGLALSLTRRVKEANNSIENNRWAREPYQGFELKGRTLGLIGYGNIGRRTAKLAKLLGMKVKYANSKSSQGKIDQIMSRSDIISLHMSLNEKSKGIINARRIGMMKKSAYLINVSRGGLVDQKALTRALKSGRIAGAALDVFQDEPKSDGGHISKDILTLARMDNVLATPHMAYNTSDSSKRLGEELMADIKSCLKGKPINVVN